MRSSRVRCSLPTALSALLFLAGGVVTYFIPQLTPPLYIAGSAVMFTHTVAVARQAPDQDRSAGGDRLGTAMRALGAAAIVAVAFWFGYLT